MREEKYFDGIILPVPFRRIGNNGRGAIMGVTMNTLETAPGDIKINIATSKRKALDQFDLYWLENCPGGNGPWGKTACYYWLLKEFSNLADLGKNAIRVKPIEGIESRASEEFIFWQNGKPVPIGHQYLVGNDIACRLLKEDPYYNGFGKLIQEWGEENYDLWSMSVGELREKTDSVIGDVPRMKIVKAERGLSIDARNAGWSSQYPLVEQVV